jgi:GNAT superfamily N-acetyltransferase
VSDLLVPLLKLPPLEPHTSRLGAMGILVRRARPYEKSHVLRFVRAHFSEGWSDEADASFAHVPVGCFVATHGEKVIGFCAIEATAPNFFGPMGVDPAHRGRGIGTALTIASLLALRDLGYVYAIIGWAGPVAFYERTVHATIIEDSEPGLYSDRLAAAREEPQR